MVVWAHNSHIGNAAATEMGLIREEINIGQLCRDRFGDEASLIGFGTELGTAYSELTDPLEQRRRLEAQSLKAASGDVEAMELDEDFLRALEHGMPPTGGLGLGVDRSLMMLTGTSIRQTVLFPFVRPT